MIGIGISKDESKVSSYADGKVKQWVTIEDFKNIFPDTLKFNFRYKGQPYSLSLYQVWDLLFMGGVFDTKLYNINEKIQTYKDAIKTGKNPYIALLEVFYPKASKRFLELAESFSILLMNLIDNNLFSGMSHSYTDLITPWHINLMRIVFGL